MSLLFHGSLNTLCLLTHPVFLRDVSLSTPGDNIDKALWYNPSILAKFQFEAELQTSLQSSIYGAIKIFNKRFFVSAVR